MKRYLLICLFLASLHAYPSNPYIARDTINNRCMNIEAETCHVHSVKDLVVNDTPLRIYTPHDGEKLPTILLIHGGAFVAGNLDTHDNLARYLCQKVNAVVVSVGYTNAPEGKFPLPLEQCYNALQWITDNLATLHARRQIAVIGDSAGGNLAAALCLLARDRNGPKIDFQVLINPVTDLQCAGTLEEQNDALDALRWQARMYIQSPEEIYNSYVSPSLAQDLTNLPPALVVLAENDDLRIDGQVYADKLQSAGTPTTVYCQLGVNHLAGHAARASQVAHESLDVVVNTLYQVFACASTTDCNNAS